MSELNFLLEPLAEQDVEFVAEVMARGEGYEDIEEFSEDFEVNRAKILDYTKSGAKFGHVIRLEKGGQSVGFLLAEKRNRLDDVFEDHSIIDELPPSLFPPDGNFCEIFDLWIDPKFRRLGLATRLKNNLEEEMEKSGCLSIYTHTEIENNHVLQLNEKLGYHQVRTGPIWDDIIRVSLIKDID